MTNPSLEHRPLGTTGLTVPALCIGCAELGNMPDTFAYAVGEEQALATVRAILTGPIPFADTAAAYGDGESERRIGLVVREMGGVPPGFVLATKADRDLQTGTFTGAQVRRSVERSLRLLGINQLPLCYLHDPEYIGFDTAMAPGGPVAVLQQCQQEGLIAHLGIAGGPIDLMTQFVATECFAVALSHNRYTLLDQSVAPFWEVCQQHGVAAINGAPYGSGILAKGPSAYPRYIYGDAPSEVIQRARALETVCERYSVPLAAAALQFSLRDSRILSTIVGISKVERLAQTLALAEVPIPPDRFTIGEAIRRALVQYGAPAELWVDHGAELVSTYVQQLTQGLGIHLFAGQPHYPKTRGVVERFHQTVDTRLWATLPGFVGHNVVERNPHAHAELTLDDVVQRFATFLAAYHQEVHSVTGQTPLTAYQTQCFPQPIDLRQLDLLLLEADTGIVQKDGIHLKTRCYWHAALGTIVNQRITFRMPLHYTAPPFIEVYVGQHWYCTATPTDVPIGQAVTQEVVIQAQREQTAALRRRLRQARAAEAESRPTADAPEVLPKSAPRPASRGRPSSPARDLPDFLDFLIQKGPQR